jgi:hypothetical protein
VWDKEGLGIVREKELPGPAIRWIIQCVGYSHRYVPVVVDVAKLGNNTYRPLLGCGKSPRAVIL